MGRIVGYFKRTKNALQKIGAKGLKTAGALTKGYGYLKDGIAFFQPVQKAGATVITSTAPSLAKGANVALSFVGGLFGYGDEAKAVGDAIESGVGIANEGYKDLMEQRQQEYYNNASYWKMFGDFLWDAGNVLEPDTFDIILVNQHYNKSKLINAKDQYAKIYSTQSTDEIIIKYMNDDIWKCKTKIKGNETHVHIPSFAKKIKFEFNYPISNYYPTNDPNSMSCSLGFVDDRTGNQKMIIFPGKIFIRFWVEDGINFHFN